MSDTTEFVNAYIESSVNTLHEYLNQVLQLKTQLKITTDSVAKKDAALSELENRIASLENDLQNSTKNLEEQLNSSKNELHQIQVKDNETINKTREENLRLQDEFNALKNKLSDFDTLVNQFNDLKKQYKEKESENQKLILELEELKNPVKKQSPKKVINTKNIPMIQATSVTNENDDF